MIWSVLFLTTISFISSQSSSFSPSDSSSVGGETGTKVGTKIGTVVSCTPIPDATIIVTQYEAEKESHSPHNRIIKKTTNFLNTHFADLTSVHIDYDGKALSGTIGKYLVTASLQRLVNEIETSECYTIDYVVEDVNECEINEHKCHSSSQCVNTVGTYECQCLTNYFGVEGSGSSLNIRKYGLCGGEKNSLNCCSSLCGSDKSCLDKCKSDFRCTNDPCLNNKCHSLAKCIPNNGSHTYSCKCPEGYIGDGSHCEKFVPRNYCDSGHTCLSPCECVSYTTEGGYRCQPPPGYIVAHNPFDLPLPRDHVSLAKTSSNPANSFIRLDHNYCFNKEGMDLRLEGPNPIYYQQGDSYEEHGLQVSDSQPENFIRRVSIQYSTPLGAYFAQPGTHHVNYTIQTPWIDGKSTITKTRKIVVSDVDECRYQGHRAIFRHRCSEEARCINAEGSYDCVCKSGFNGTGFNDAYGKSGCKDTRPPVLSCIGRGCSPMSFRAVSVVGIMSIDASTSDLLKEITELTDYQFVSTFLEKNKQLLCSPSDPCFFAYDEILTGTVDLTSRVMMHNIVSINITERQITYSIPYSVSDDAGNLAGPLNLTLHVELVDIKDHLSGNLISVPRQKYISVFLLVVGISFLFFLISLRSLIACLRVMLHAIQFAMYPYSLIAQRKDFEEGMDVVLQVMSFGLMTKTERARRIASKWNSLVESAEEENHED